MKIVSKNNFNYLVLGASGLQGKIVSRDLLEKGQRVLLADLYRSGSKELIKKYPGKASFKFVDLRRIMDTVELIKWSGANIVINCAEGDWNLNVYRACLKAKVNVLDLGSKISMTKQQLAMDKEFKKVGLVAITGCGSTPGINNVMLQYAERQFDDIHTVNAGFAWDSNIKRFVVPFSIESIIEEFTWEAPIVESGKWQSRMPLENITEKEFRAIGRQSIFLVEHAETFTFYHYFKDKGLQNIKFYAGFPEHSTNTIMTLIELGLGKKDAIVVDGPRVAPVNLLTRVLKELETPKDYFETENLWVEILGQKDDKPKRILMECIVPTLPGWEDAGCNIDTGLPASIIAQMIADGRITARGSFAPEAGIIDEDDFFKELAAREMVVYQNGVPINKEIVSQSSVPRIKHKLKQAEVYV